MPFGDGTGPMGQGPMRGRGRGLCRGRQGGFGVCRQATPADPAMLTTRIDWLESVLATLKQRLTASKAGEV